jgi:hypothetical protein
MQQSCRRVLREASAIQTCFLQTAFAKGRRSSFGNGNIFRRTIAGGARGTQYHSARRVEQTRISCVTSKPSKRMITRDCPAAFNKSFIKSYARHIGFNENEALEGYARAARSKANRPTKLLRRLTSRASTDDSTRSPIVTAL